MRKFLLYFFTLILDSLLSFIVFFRPEPVKFNTVTVEGKFSISVPSYLSKTDSIDASALLQYKNEQKQIFVLVYEEADTMNQSLETFFKKFADDFISRIGRGNLIKYYPEQINSHNVFIGNIRGSVNQTGVYYRIAIIEAGNVFYELILGVSDNSLSSFDTDINGIINSFTLLPS